MRIVWRDEGQSRENEEVGQLAKQGSGDGGVRRNEKGVCGESRSE